MLKSKMHPSTLNFLATGGLAHQRDVELFDPLTGLRQVPLTGSVCFAEGGGDDGGGGGDDGGDGGGDDGGGDDQVFTAAQVEQQIKRRIRRVRKEYKDQLSAAEKAQAEMQEQLDALTSQLEESGGEEKKKVTAAERELTKLQARLAEVEETTGTLTAERDAATAALKSYIVKDRIRSALVEAKVIPSGLDHAVALMSTEYMAELETDEETGEHSVVLKMDGRETEDLKLAANTWLKKNTHFALHPGGGTGEGTGRGGNGKRNAPLTPETIEKSDPSKLITDGLGKALGAG